MKKIIYFGTILTSLFVLHYSVFTPKVYAVCPVCTVAVGAGLGISRALGIDDAVTSVWIGGLIISISFWTVSWIENKKIKLLKDLKNSTLTLASIALWAILTIFPLYTLKYIGRPLNALFGVDKIILGTIIGSVMFFAAVFTDKKLRSIYGKQFFNYQKVVFPVIFLLVSSLIMYFVTK